MKAIAAARAAQNNTGMQSQLSKNVSNPPGLNNNNSQLSNQQSLNQSKVSPKKVEKYEFVISKDVCNILLI